MVDELPLSLVVGVPVVAVSPVVGVVGEPVVVSGPVASLVAPLLLSPSVNASSPRPQASKSVVAASETRR